MIIESDNIVYIVENVSEDNEGNVVKAIRSDCTDEWLVFSENEYGELNIESITDMEFSERYGELPE
jgi:hypothetical protein